jgi:hypothetical protein
MLTVPPPPKPPTIPEPGPSGLEPLLPGTGADQHQELVFASLDFAPDQDAEFIRQLFLLNRFM